MNYSFYGGPPGKNFEIAKIFHNKVELMEDLMKRWHSSVGIGDLVLISYGLPSDLVSDSYQDNKQKDESIWGASYNVTLWQKIYTEPADAAESESLALLRALNQKYKEFRENNIELPQEYWNEYYAIGGLETQYIINGLDRAEANYQTALKTAITDSDKERAKEEYYEEFKKAIQNRDYNNEDFGLGYKLIASLIGSTPVLDLDFSEIDADKKPNSWLSFVENNLERPILHLRLPQSQLIEVGTVNSIGTTQKPVISLDKTNINSPKLNFSLPRPPKFMYGNRLGSYDKNRYTLNIIDNNDEIGQLDIGDYYIQSNEPKDISGKSAGAGFIYLVVDKTLTSRTFEYQACLAGPIPDIKIKEPVTFVGPDENGMVENKRTGENEYSLSFTIPSGARFYSTKEDDIAIVDDDHPTVKIMGARPGDFYINTASGSKYRGCLYKLSANGVWIFQGSIKGEIGNSLNITHSYTITPQEIQNNSLIDTVESVSSYLKGLLNNQLPGADEIIAVTYQALSEDEEIMDISYWYYCINGIWDRVRLTGINADGSLKSTTVAYNHTILANSWIVDSENGFVSTWEEPRIQCGKNHNVPPEITFTSNREEYSEINSAIAENGVGIKFYIRKKPSNDIGIIVIDQM